MRIHQYLFSGDVNAPAGIATVELMHGVALGLPRQCVRPGAVHGGLGEVGMGENDEGFHALCTPIKRENGAVRASSALTA